MTVETMTIASEHDGTIGVHEDGRAFIRFTRTLPHPVARVWEAITRSDEMESWLAHRVAIEPRAGGRLSLWVGNLDNPRATQYAISVFDPPHVLEAVGQGTDGTLRWEVRPTDGGCELTFSDTRPAGERASNSARAGWHFRMELLLDALDGTPADWAALDATRDEHGVIARIAELYRHYRRLD
jgi:uncharacterized protein YndB with AHSA1/START domain